MMPAEEKDDQSGQRNQRKDVIVSPEQAPRRTGIAPVHNPEKSVNQNFLTGNITQKFQDQSLGQLV
jgi:hypothetical protein